MNIFEKYESALHTIASMEDTYTPAIDGALGFLCRLLIELKPLGEVGHKKAKEIWEVVAPHKKQLMQHMMIGICGKDIEQATEALEALQWAENLSNGDKIS